LTQEVDHSFLHWNNNVYNREGVVIVKYLSVKLIDTATRVGAGRGDGWWWWWLLLFILFIF
jgi:hypothetical protein